MSVGLYFSDKIGLKFNLVKFNVCSVFCPKVAELRSSGWPEPKKPTAEEEEKAKKKSHAITITAPPDMKAAPTAAAAAAPAPSAAASSEAAAADKKAGGDAKAPSRQQSVRLETLHPLIFFMFRILVPYSS